MGIQEEIHKALAEIQQKVNKNEDLSVSEMEMLFLSSLVEEEGK